MTKEEAIKYIQENNFDVQNANASLYAAELVFQSYVDSKSVHGVDFKPVLSHFTLKREDFFYFHQIISIDTLRAIGEKIYRDYLDDPQSLKRKMEEHRSLEKKLDNIWKEYKKGRELKGFFKELMEISIEWWKYASIGEDKGEVINNVVVPSFAKRHNLDLVKARSILSSLAHPEKPTVLNSERISFLNICLSFANDSKQLDKQMKEYIKTYFWVDTDFYSAKEVTKESILKKAEEEIEKNKKEGIIKELSSIKDSFVKLHKEKEEIKKQIKLSSEDKRDILFSKNIIEWMDERKFGMMKECYYLFSTLKDIVLKYDLKYCDFSSYRMQEMFDLLETGKKVDKEEIKKRQDDIFIINERGKEISMFYGKDAGDLLNEVIQKRQTNEIKGTVASKGNQTKVVGTISIVLDVRDEKFLEGAILVTSMTRVEFVPLMRKAKAVITNEGGVACHAAIVSRELNIPCIIGTKIATKNLKNGDRVEMDLNTGIVKILNQ